MHYPTIGNKALGNLSQISELGISDFEAVVIKPYKHEPPYHDRAFYCMALVKDFTNFQEMTLSNGNPKQKEEGWYGEELVLYATLLYTDEDTLLAKYVRENFDELHKMSGENLKIFVVESPPKDSIYAAPHYWKGRLEQTVYMA